MREALLITGALATCGALVAGRRLAEDEKALLVIAAFLLGCVANEVCRLIAG